MHIPINPQSQTIVAAGSTVNILRNLQIQIVTQSLRVGSSCTIVAGWKHREYSEISSNAGSRTIVAGWEHCEYSEKSSYADSCTIVAGWKHCEYSEKCSDLDI